MPNRLWSKTSIEKFVDDNYRYYVQLQVACILLGTTALLMSIMNAFVGGKWVLVVATFSFFAACCVNYILLKRYQKITPMNLIIFEVALLLLCTYFMVTGGKDGFSPYWIIILPFCTITLMGRKRGSALTLVLLAEMIFLYWLPWGRSLLTYAFSETFMLRFPLVYIVASLFAYGFETSRFMTIRQMQKEHNAVRILSETDRLTGLKNRYWFQEKMERMTRKEKEENKCAALLLMDIDGFKHINDTYGHKTGDHVLEVIAAAMKEFFHPEDLLCRWGGEEFLAYLPSCEPQEAERAGNVICQLVRKINVESDDGTSLKLTISVGVVVIPGEVQVDESEAFIEADKQLYAAKKSGRDRVSVKIMG